MRRFLLPTLAVSLLLVGRSPARAQDDVQAIIAKAIKAHGGEEKIDKHKAAQIKMKGIVHIMGGINYTEDAAFHLPNKIKSVQRLEINGQQVTITIGYNGKEAWMNLNGMNIDQMIDKITELLKEQAYMSEVSRLTPLKDKKFELSALGEGKVEGKPALGVRVSSKGHKDVNLYFDKATGLLTKIEHRTIDPASGKELNEERVITEYKDVDGEKEVKKAVVYRDGEKYVDAEVVEIKHLDSIDDSEFNKP
jgi:hypothetical protein